MTPADWSIREISELGKVQAGRQRAPHFTGTMRRYLRVANVFDGYIDTDDVLQMPFSDQEYEQYRLRAGDILLNEGQSRELVGRSAIYQGDPTDCCFQNTLIRFRSGSEIVPEFAHLLFQHLQYTGIFERIALQTTSVAHLGVSRFAQLKVHVPPLAEQRSIIDVLSVWTKRNGLLDKSLAEKKTLKAGLFQQLLTGKRRFKEFIRSTETRSTRYGTFPMDWAYLPIASIAEEVSHKSSKSDSLSVLSCTKHRGLVDSLAYFGKRVFSDNTEGYKLVLRGQFAYATNHLEEGSIGLLTHRDSGLVSPMYTVFRTGDRVHPEFLYSLLKTDTYRHIFRANTNASVNRRGGLRWDQFADIRIWLPSIPEQQKISRVVSCFDNELELIRHERALLEKQKRGLMASLLSGRVRLESSQHLPVNARTDTAQCAVITEG
jgi:type I restriction enzyme, S subunit